MFVGISFGVICGVLIFWALLAGFLRLFHFPFLHSNEKSYLLSIFYFLISGIILSFFARDWPTLWWIGRWWEKEDHFSRISILIWDNMEFDFFAPSLKKFTQSSVLLTLCNIISNWKRSFYDLFIVVAVGRLIIAVTHTFFSSFRIHFRSFAYDEHKNGTTKKFGWHVPATVLF